ncbi:hypothetical protein [Pseudomonas sp. CMR5c]|uniref:hypothetical protein n=1 Tax=Pseudomonas sp. CMR5c TaxID=658630 RepID=UPI000ACB2D74|nr:hypothetical protein [Pseudomonas sp. CMR5c]AZC16276.1 hypothetical protein C4K40_0864 [Pseudomonas sp. CMR5c]
MNKDEELKIFRQVFGHLFDDLLDHTESPDFIIKSNQIHGIEITEVYCDATEARLRHADGYLENLLSGTGKVFRSDKDTITVDTIEIYNEDGGLHSENIAVIRKVISLEEALNKIAYAIKEKSKKSSTYLDSCHTVDLVINDSSGLFHIQDDEIFHQLFVHHLDRSALRGSSFREIFFVCDLWSRQRVYLPIKLNLFISDFLGILEIAESEASEDWTESTKQIEAVLLALYELGHTNFSYEHMNGELHIDLGGAVIEFTDTGTNIKDHTTLLVEHGLAHKVGELRSCAPAETIDLANRLKTRRWENSAYVRISYPVMDSLPEQLQSAEAD